MQPEPNTRKKPAQTVASVFKVKAENITENPALRDIGLLFIAGGAGMPELTEYSRNAEAPLPEYAALVTGCAPGRQKQAAALHSVAKKFWHITEV